MTRMAIPILPSAPRNGEYLLRVAHCMKENCRTLIKGHQGSEEPHPFSVVYYLSRSRMKLTIVLFIILSAIHSFPAAAGGENENGKPIGEVAPNCKSIECPIYETLYMGPRYEIRRYNHTVWMSTSSVRDISFVEATRKGFLRLFDYIQGKNEEQAKVPMTAPVLTDVFPSAGPFCKSSFVVSFFLPKGFQEKPPVAYKDLELHPQRWGVRYAAVRRFGGFAHDYIISGEASKLRGTLYGSPWASAIAKSQSQQGGGTVASYSVAQYNSPFEFDNRVNEIWLLFDQQDDSSPQTTSSA